MLKADQRQKAASEYTRDRILQAASSLFAAQGFKATTLREITEAAQANLASVNYHFQSKDVLVASTIEAAVKPIVAARMAALEACLARPEPAGIRELSRALVNPLYELNFGKHRNSIRLLMQLSPDPEISSNTLVSRHFAPLHRKFVAALEAVLPELSKGEIALRYDCARGATLQTLVELAPARELVSLPAQHVKLIRDRNQSIEALVAFVTAGFLAPSTFALS